MTKLTNKLLRMKQQIDDDKIEEAKIAGQIETQESTLQSRFDCKTMKQAETKLLKWEKEIGGMDKELEKGVDKLEEEYEWD